ncbi:MAG: P-loop NTPase [Candidatus Berkelbacteria bacterium]
MKTTAIVSQVGGTGKTTLSIALAVELAKAGRKTCLVDLDFDGSYMLEMLSLVDSVTVTSNQLIDMRRFNSNDTVKRLSFKQLAAYHGAYVVPVSEDPAERWRSNIQETIVGYLEFAFSVRDILARLKKLGADHVLLDAPSGSTWLGTAVLDALDPQDNVVWCVRKSAIEVANHFYSRCRVLNETKCMVVSPNYKRGLSARKKLDLQIHSTRWKPLKPPETKAFHYVEVKRPLITKLPNADNPTERQMLESIARWVDEQ